MPVEELRNGRILSNMKKNPAEKQRRCILAVLILTFAAAAPPAVIIVIMMHGTGGKETEGGEQHQCCFHEIFHSGSYKQVRMRKCRPKVERHCSALLNGDAEAEDTGVGAAEYSSHRENRGQLPALSVSPAFFS
jgi:hypothetical protein